jgi:DNA-binding NarL/FixJ family response regulator
VFVLWMCVMAIALIQDQSPADDWFFRAGVLFAAWIPGVVARRLRVSEQAAQEAAAEEKRRAETGAEQAVARERARIARELHDVVAHAVTLMVVQAAVAEELHERDSQAARAALASVQMTGRAAIAELDRMLRLLREPGSGVGPLPSLAGLPDLIAEANRAGVRAELVEEMSSADAISPAMQICAYRVVQEALTNAAKHTRNPHVRVVLRHSTETLEIEVEDDGGAGPLDTPGTGYGLTGLRERVSLFGGTLQTGPAADGAEAVTAARTHRTDVVLMDTQMLRVDGIEATRRIIASGAATRILMLTTFGLDQYVYDALRAGASGFLLKSVPPEELVAGIRVVARGDALLAPALTRRMIEDWTRRPPPGGNDPRLARLTEREREVLRLVATVCPTASWPPSCIWRMRPSRPT